MRFLVHGAGGLGLYLAGTLGLAGADVTLLARPGTPAGRLTLIRHGRRTEVRGVAVARALEDVPAPDLVLLAVKAWQVADAAAELAKVIGPRTLVLPPQNGIDAPATLAAVLGQHRVAGCTCVVVTERTGPLAATCHGGAARLELGNPDPVAGPDEHRLTAAAALLRAAGLYTTVVEDIRLSLWRKLMLVASYGGAGAVSRVPAGVLASTPELCETVERAMREAAAVARAQGVSLTETHVGEAMRVFRALPPNATASMHRDLAAGRPSELADQNGAIVRRGQLSGVDTPVHQCLYAALLPAENTARRGTS